MTIRSKTTLKTYFNTGDTPSEANFADWIETMAVRTITVGPAGSDADYVCDGTADDVEIQAAIDAVAALTPVMGLASMGTVVILRGEYDITATIDLKEHVSLELQPGAILNIGVDVDGVNLKKGASIQGGVLYTGDVQTYSSDVLRVDGSSLVFAGNAYSYMMPAISNLKIHGYGNSDGTAIHFISDETAAPGRVYGMAVRNVGIWKLKYGIRLESLNLDQQPANSVGACIFRDVYMWYPLYGIYMVTATWEQVNGNVFENIHMLCDPVNTLRGIYCEGSYNHFDPIYVWDLAAPNKSLEFANNAARNRAKGIFGTAFIINNDPITNLIDDYFA